MNRWLDTTVAAHEKHFGKTGKPVIYEVGSRDGNDGVELGRRIFGGEIFWRN